MLLTTRHPSIAAAHHFIGRFDVQAWAPDASGDGEVCGGQAVSTARVSGWDKCTATWMVLTWDWLNFFSAFVSAGLDERSTRHLVAFVGLDQAHTLSAAAGLANVTSL